MVGAVATLAGVCRVHISLVVVMFELTGIDDCHIRRRGYPHLSGSDQVFKSRACDIMDEELVCLTCEAARVSELLDLVRGTPYGGPAGIDLRPKGNT
ncbi:CLCN5 [Symbiodinium sp. KB8]|nr:CLCN5 [Symbiodinium sp. KB8]